MESTTDDEEVFYEEEIEPGVIKTRFKAIKRRCFEATTCPICLVPFRDHYFVHLRSCKHPVCQKCGSQIDKCPFKCDS